VRGQSSKIARMGDEKTIPEQLALLRRGLADELPAGGLHEKLIEKQADGKPLRVKLGVDPTASRVHLGWAVVLRKLRQFQECGHTAVLIIGDFTAQVGDPSGKSKTRRRLSSEEVQQHADACIAALRRILLPEPLEIRYNSEWLGQMSMEDVLHLSASTTVAQLLERDDFSKRFAASKAISLTEFMYPLLQAQDSVAVAADVEIGGTDQTFNTLMGRHLQHSLGQPGQVVCTLPLLVGTDGVEKMSQSLGNVIGVDEPPNEMFGKLMSIPDHLIVDYARLAVWWSTADVEALAVALEDASRHPNEAKRSVGRDLVDLYWETGAGEEAERAFDYQFKGKGIPKDVPEHWIETDQVQLVDLVASVFGVSRSEARRLVEQGGVKLDGVVLRDRDAMFAVADINGGVLQAGKRRFFRLCSGQAPIS